jgi:hypothetical protein
MPSVNSRSALITVLRLTRAFSYCRLATTFESFGHRTV